MVPRIVVRGGVQRRFGSARPCRHDYLLGCDVTNKEIPLAHRRPASTPRVHFPPAAKRPVRILIGSATPNVIGGENTTSHARCEANRKHESCILHFCWSGSARDGRSTPKKHQAGDFAAYVQQGQSTTPVKHISRSQSKLASLMQPSFVSSVLSLGLSQRARDLFSRGECQQGTH